VIILKLLCHFVLCASYLKVKPS